MSDINNNIVELGDEQLEQVTGGSKIVTTGNVNVRSGPGLDFRSLGTVSSGTSLTYDGASEKDGRGVRWYRVRYHGSFGWVSSKYSKKR